MGGIGTYYSSNDSFSLSWSNDLYLQLFARDFSEAKKTIDCLFNHSQLPVTSIDSFG